MANFFKHKNQLCPPSLSAYGKLHFSKTSDLLNIISQRSEQDPPSYFDSMAIDGAALVHLLPVNNYASMIFVPRTIAKQLQKSTRVHLVWDTYIDNSVKASTRQK